MRATLIVLLILLIPLLNAQTAPKAPPLRELSASSRSSPARVRPAVVQIFSTGYAAAEEARKHQRQQPAVDASAAPAPA